MFRQEFLTASEDYRELDAWLGKAESLLLVCGQSIHTLRINTYFDALESRTGKRVIKFSHFHPNPLYDSVVKGVKSFRENSCDTIIAVGGGSAIDVAKCIKLYSGMDPAKSYLEQPIVPNDIPFLAVPTTAGTGSESTRYAVIYDKGEKLSITDDSCIPPTVLMDASALNTLPEYQRKATMMDALCHAVESYWSINSTEESRTYSKEAIQLILKYKGTYLSNDEYGNAVMLRAANMAGRAINITQTTAGHAMSYKLTSLYGIAHGHAAALCVSKLWPYMLSHIQKCVDFRRAEYLENMFQLLAEAMGCNTSMEAAWTFQKLLDSLSLTVPVPQEEDFRILSASVNTERLKNTPIVLDTMDLDILYHQILDVRQGR